MDKPDALKSIDSAPMKRRDFIDLVIKGGLLTTLAGMLFPALSYLWPVTRRGPAQDLMEVGRVDEFQIGGSKKVVVSGSALLVIRTPKEFKAFSAICTHLGCIVYWDSDKKIIVCPCHAGLFDVEGKVVSGPPPRPLAPHEVKIIGDKIYVKP